MKILVVGDSVLDRYVYGLVKRQSPEDPTVPVVDYINEEYRLGGCLNVAINLKALQNPRDDVYISAIYSSHTEKQLLEKKIICEKACIVSDQVSTLELIKTRIVNSETLKQIARVDNRLKFNPKTVKEFKENIFFLTNVKDFDAIIVSDYNKGTIDLDIVKFLEEKDCPIFVDTKKSDFSIWKNLKNYYVKINLNEYLSANKESLSNIKNLIVTSGENGAMLYDSGKMIQLFNTKKIKDGNVIGAGDVFLAGLVAIFAETKDLNRSIDFAIKAATKSVERFGTCEISRREIYEL